MPWTEAQVPLLDPLTDKFPDRFAPPSVAADKIAAAASASAAAGSALAASGSAGTATTKAQAAAGSAAAALVSEGAAAGSAAAALLSEQTATTQAQDAENARAAAVDAKTAAEAARDVAASSAAIVQQVTLTGNLTYTLPGGIPAGIVHRVMFTQDGVGGRTVTYGGQPVTVCLTAGATTLVEVWPSGEVTYPLSATAATRVAVWDEASLSYPTRPPAALVIWRGPLDPALIVGSGFLPNIDMWVANAMDAAAPSVVTNLTATPGATSAALAWTAATDDKAVTGYEYRTGAGAWVDAGAPTSKTVSGLTIGTPYTFGVRAYDAIGHKGAEVTVAATTRSAVFTNFSEYTTGAAPTGWTHRWNTTGVTTAVVDDAAATGGKVLRMARAAAGATFLSWDAVPSSATTQEIVTRFRIVGGWSGSVTAYVLRVCGAGAAGTESAYAAQIKEDANSVYMSKYVNGAFTLEPTPFVYSLEANIWCWARLRYEAGHVFTRFWADGASEPGTWTKDWADSSLTSGRLGIGLNSPLTVEWDVVGADWAGGAAPKVAV